MPLELDEAWSFVTRKLNPCWLWIAFNRATRRVQAWATGDRSLETFWRLWDAIPGSKLEKVAHGYATDEWLPYEVIPSERRTTLNGQTNHAERFFCTLRQRLARFTRKSLAFSKSEVMHVAALTVFIDLYNQSR
jgi:IS1 family transposase